MENNTIILSAIIQRNNEKFIANKLGEEMVMMNMENGDFITMNSVGADIWALCEQPLPVKELIEKLVILYDITEDQCTSETVQFLQTSMEQNIFTFTTNNV
jgi:hypothetical protein